MSRESEIAQRMMELRGAAKLAMDNMKVAKGFCNCVNADYLQDGIRAAHLVESCTRELVALLFDENGKLQI
jgi:hypothetical protein